ncbi:sulfite exporter TauE/SafE family protein [Comamonas sp. JC664]|uniref:sulfite exporter TauE/SafE family protein n=1 Tax=Comamonas sp. JC664 TaxID=2801917 RepID=UPI00174E4228|nr:sulfite exporter TauE/SafE family protein [Comamonas sp. JC664]MBL0692546.1 sulfite exporter TauE/SafE family protein [Comamonas sp. JC664]GHG92502.1 membrane protein [Comamonas sp. KCTC 72670]
MSPLESLTANPWLSWLLAAAVFVLAGTVKGVVGLGLPTIAMALLALLMSPAQAAALLIVPSLVTNVWQLRPWGSLGPMSRRLAPMQAGTCVGTLAGAWVLGAPVGAWATVSLGVALMAYAAWGLSGARFKVGLRAEQRVGPWVGVATGLVTAATGVFVIPAVPYLQALGFDRDELLQAMGISFTVSTVALAAGLSLNAGYSSAALGMSLVMLLPALVGMQAGQWLRQKLSPTVFRKCFMASLVLLGAHMVGRELLTG